MVIFIQERPEKIDDLAEKRVVRPLSAPKSIAFLFKSVQNLFDFEVVAMQQMCDRPHGAASLSWPPGNSRRSAAQNVEQDQFRTDRVEALR
jgi:hypothetical protein